MRRAVGGVTSDEIRRVALDMFSAQGYDGTSIRDIADGVSIRGSSMYNHFASKEAILWDLCSRALDRLHETWQEAESRLPPSATPLERLTAFVSSDVRYHAESRQEAVIINAQLGRLDAAHRAFAVKRRADYEAILTDIVHQCVGAERAAEPSTRMTVYAILQMAAAVANWYRPDGPLDIDQICEAYSAMALKLVR